MPLSLSLPEVVLAAGLLVLGGLWAVVWRKQVRQETEWRKQFVCREREWALRVAQLEERLEQLAAAAEGPSPWRPRGIDRHKRMEALFMLRRGDAPATVAAALSIPSGEMELLLRVQALRAPPAAMPAGKG